MSTTKKTERTTERMANRRITQHAAHLAQQQTPACLLTDEQKDALRRLYDRAEEEACWTDLAATASYRRIGIAQGIERAASLLGFDIYADWQERHSMR